LTTQELCHVLAIESGAKELDPNAVYDINDVLSAYAGLVTADNKSDAVLLVYYTTQEYLKRVRLKWIPTA
jgi:hypothetical protein